MTRFGRREGRHAASLRAAALLLVGLASATGPVDAGDAEAPAAKAPKGLPSVKWDDGPITCRIPLPTAATLKRECLKLSFKEGVFESTTFRLRGDTVGVRLGLRSKGFISRTESTAEFHVSPLGTEPFRRVVDRYVGTVEGNVVTELGPGLRASLKFENSTLKEGTHPAAPVSREIRSLKTSGIFLSYEFTPNSATEPGSSKVTEVFVERGGCLIHLREIDNGEIAGLAFFLGSMSFEDGDGAPREGAVDAELFRIGSSNRSPQVHETYCGAVPAALSPRRIFDRSRYEKEDSLLFETAWSRDLGPDERPGSKDRRVRQPNGEIRISIGRIEGEQTPKDLLDRFIADLPEGGRDSDVRVQPSTGLRHMLGAWCSYVERTDDETALKFIAFTYPPGELPAANYRKVAMSIAEPKGPLPPDAAMDDAGRAAWEKSQTARIDAARESARAAFQSLLESGYGWTKTNVLPR